MTPPVVRLVAALALGTLVTYAPACSDDHDHEEGTGPTDVVYEGGTNDEAVQALLDAAPKSDPTLAPVLVLPAAGAKVPAATPATFQWKASATASLPLPLPLPLPHERIGLPTFALPFGKERQAHAHGDPVNGKAYLLVLSVAGNDKLVRVFTTATSYTPDAATWQKLVAAKTTLSAVVTSASYDNNNLVAGSGPYASSTLTFTIE